MANIASNPWSFKTADVITTPITSLTLQPDGTVVAVVTSTAAFNFTGLVLTAVDNNGNYTGTITGGANNAFVGFVATFSGFVNGVNNSVNAEITGSTATTISTNLTTIAETHAGAVSGQVRYVTVSDASIVTYNWFYQILTITNATTMTLVPNPAFPPHILSTTPAAGAAGVVSVTQYRDWVRVEDISWQNPSAAGQALDIRDRNGNIIWQATSTGAGSQNRGKVFWVNGLTLLVLQSGVVLATVN